MSSGQWDLKALEAIEREASEIFDVLEVPERLRAPATPKKTKAAVDQLSEPGSPEMDFELQDHIKHCSCSCNHMGYGNYMDYQQTSCFGGLPDVTEHTTGGNHHHSHHQHLRNSKRGCKSNKQTLPPLLESRASNESLPSCATTTTSALETTAGILGKKVLASNHVPAPTSTKSSSYDIFDAKSCFFPSSLSSPSANASPTLTLSTLKIGFEDITSPMAITSKTANIANNSYQSSSMIGVGLGICGIMNLRKASSGSGEKEEVSSVLGETDLNGTIETLSASSQRRNKGSDPDRKWCYFVVTFFIALTICVVVVSLALEILLGSGFIDRNSDDYRLQTIRRILKETPLIDGHNDLPWNIKRYSHNRFEFLNLSEGLDEIAPWSHSPWSQTDIPKLKKGLVGAQFWSAYVPCEAQGLDAVQLALEQIDVIQRFTELYDKYTTLVVSTKEIMETHRRGLISSMIGVEGGHALGSSLGVLRSMYSLGVRYLTLTHKCDITWAGSSATLNDKGLTPFGRSVVKEMNRLGMIIDLSHSSDQTAKDVLKETRAPVIYSHSAARSICNLSRNVDDELLRLIAENGGIVMISFYSLHISCRQISTISDVIAHINYIRSVAGIQHIGIGAGYDGIDRPPIGLEDVSKYPDLFAKLLEDPSWNEQEISLLAGKNFLRVLESVENVRDYWRSANVPPIEKSEPIQKSPCAYMPL